MNWQFHIIIPLLIFPLTSPAAEWQRTPDMPTPRQEIYVAATNGAIYVPGGILKDGSSFTAVLERFDTGKNRWQTLAPMPEARHHITPAIVDGKLYAIGGFSGGFPHWILHTDVFVYDLAADHWGHGTAMPAAQGEHIQAVVNDRIHIIGGRIAGKENPQAFDDYVDTVRHWIYDPATDTWSKGRPAPTARNSAAAAVHDGIIYVAGGRRNVIRDDGTQIQTNLDILERYDPSTDTWTTLAPMPLASGGLAAAVVDGRLFVFGGEQWTPEKKVFADALVYDISTDNWSSLPDMPTGRHGLAAAAVNGKVYVIGGCTVVGGGAATGVTELLQIH